MNKKQFIVYLGMSIAFTILGIALGYLLCFYVIYGFSYSYSYNSILPP